ncbi:MAG: hypothetical protein J6S38_01710, partial [Erysipelotrichaceae bacterium]|nr:hypothetical protein [Erysipelotrichaceae bacterium]
DKNYQFVKENINRVDHQFTFEEIRQIDQDLLKDSKRNYYIDDKTGRYDISISGLELALAELDGLKYFGDTYYVLIRSIPYFDNSTLKKYAAAYDFDIVDGQNLDFRFNFEKIEPEAPVIISLNIPEKRNDLIYSVYHLDKNGDIVKMRTTQSDNYIQYMAKESGSYIVLSKESANEYHISDYGENLSLANMGVDNHRYNFKMFMILVIALIGIIGIVFYYVLNDRNEKLWKEFKKSLRTPDFVQEEKPKN